MPSTPITDVYARILESFRRNDLEDAYRLHERLLPLISTTMQSDQTGAMTCQIMERSTGSIASV